MTLKQKLKELEELEPWLEKSEYVHLKQGILIANGVYEGKKK